MPRQSSKRVLSPAPFSLFTRRIFFVQDRLVFECYKDFSGILGKGKIAMGDPEHVPAGIYGKQALAHLGVWDDIASKVVRVKDVRAALVFV